jgi:hypothetical protein
MMMNYEFSGIRDEKAMIPYATVSECVSRGRRNPERFLVNTCAL